MISHQRESCFCFFHVVVAGVVQRSTPHLELSAKDLANAPKYGHPSARNLIGAHKVHWGLGLKGVNFFLIHLFIYSFIPLSLSIYLDDYY